MANDLPGHNEQYRLKLDGDYARALHELAALDGEAPAVVVRRLIRAEAKARGVGWAR